jgi:hypothetical protein
LWLLSCRASNDPHLIRSCYCENKELTLEYLQPFGLSMALPWIFNILGGRDFEFLSSFLSPTTMSTSKRDGGDGRDGH